VAETLPAVRRVLHPLTAEVLELESTGVAELARAIDEVRQLENELRAFKARVGDELLARMDRAARWTLRRDGWEITGDSPRQTAYDGDRLAGELDALVEQDVISREAADAAVRHTWEARKAGVNALLALGGVVAEAVQRCQTTPPPRRVKKVARLAGAPVEATAEELPPSTTTSEAP
jgi:hypothetical protein